MTVLGCMSDVSAGASPKAIKERARDRSVLVVDDDDAVRDVVAEVLRSEGYRVTCAQNGERAMVELRRLPPPDVVLLDLTMPVMSGWEVLEEVQEDPSLSHIPIVVVSAMAGPGIADHLSKPIEIERLLATVGRLTA